MMAAVPMIARRSPTNGSPISAPGTDRTAQLPTAARPTAAATGRGRAAGPDDAAGRAWVGSDRRTNADLRCRDVGDRATQAAAGRVAAPDVAWTHDRPGRLRSAVPDVSATEVCIGAPVRPH